MRIGALLLAWRNKYDKKAGELAKDIGIPIATLYRLEAGDTVPDGTTLAKVLTWSMGKPA
jgi:transcriptional regulator with XRE-family HTH domain